MPQDYTQDMAALREWLAKEPYLPSDFEDIMLKKFLHSCYGSLERTKKCIERFCVTRANMTDVYTDRDPASPKMKTAFSLALVGTYGAGENEILIHRLDTQSYDKLVFSDLVKSFAIQADQWLKVIHRFPEGHIIMFDLKNVTLKIIPKLNILFLRDFLLFLLEGMPVRVKQVHVVNCPSYYDTLYALVRPILPPFIREIIIFHSTLDTLHAVVDKKYLPKEYEGEASESLKAHHEHWVNEYVLPGNREWFFNDNLWKADLKKKPQGAVENAMSGSFRTLSID